MSMNKWIQGSFWLGKCRSIGAARTSQSFVSKCKQIRKTTTPLTKRRSISLGLFKSIVSAGLLACVVSTEVHAEDACIPKLVTELFFFGEDVLPGVYLGLHMIGDLPKHVAESPRIRSFLYGYTDFTSVPLIVVGGKAPSSNYRLQMMPQENGVNNIVWVQRSFSDLGMMALGHPMWLGLWPSKCAETAMTVTYAK